MTDLESPLDSRELRALLFASPHKRGRQSCMQALRSAVRFTLSGSLLLWLCRCGGASDAGFDAERGGATVVKGGAAQAGAPRSFGGNVTTGGVSAQGGSTSSGASSGGAADAGTAGFAEAGAAAQGGGAAQAGATQGGAAQGGAAQGGSAQGGLAQGGAAQGGSAEGGAGQGGAGGLAGCHPLPVANAVCARFSLSHFYACVAPYTAPAGCVVRNQGNLLHQYCCP